MMTQPNMLAVALKLRSLGLCPIPCWTPEECAAGKCIASKNGGSCDKPGKHPRIKWKELQAAPLAEAGIEKLFKKWPRANIAIPTGRAYGIVVVDLDSPDALAWAEAHLPATPMKTLTGIRNKETGWRGQQWFYGHPGDGPISNKAKLRAKGSSKKLDLDIRADGGYVMAPGSLHPSGAIYGNGAEKWSIEAIRALPKIDRSLLVEERREPMSVFERALRYAEAKGPAIEGAGGDAHTFELACDLVRGFGLSDGEAFSVMRQWNSMCQPPWKEAELQAKLEHAKSYGKRPVGYLLGDPPSSKTYQAASRPGRVVSIEEVKAQAEHPSAETIQEEAWPDPIPIGTIKTPEFDCSILPEPLASFVAELSEATQTPPAAAMVAALSAVATAVAKKAEVELMPEWKEPLCLFTAMVLPPGERKTAVVNRCKAPLEEWEREQAKVWGQRSIESKTRRQVFEVRAKAAQKRAASTKDGLVMEAAMDEAVRFAKQAEECQVVEAPRLLVGDITGEKLVGMMEQNGGKIALITDEGGIFDVMAGMYANGAPKIDPYLQGHTGQGSIRVDRIGRPSQIVPNPTLTLCLAIQPEVVRSLASRPGFRGRGLLGRFLYAIPASRLGSRPIDANPMQRRTMDLYRACLRTLLDAPMPTDPVALRLDREAAGAFRAFRGEVEPQLEQDACMGAMTDWGGKLVGAVARLAGILHFAENWNADPFGASISVNSVNRAVELGRFFQAHAQAAFGEMNIDATEALARNIIRWLGKSKLDQFTKRDVYRALYRHVRKADEIEAPWALLMERGHIRSICVNTVNAKKGRRGQLFSLNPKSLGFVSTQTRGANTPLDNVLNNIHSFKTSVLSVDRNDFDPMDQATIGSDLCQRPSIMHVDSVDRIPPTWAREPMESGFNSVNAHEWQQEADDFDDTGADREVWQ